MTQASNFERATVTECKSHLYGTLVYVQAESGTMRLVQPVRGGPQTMVSKIHLRIEAVAA